MIGFGASDKNIGLTRTSGLQSKTEGLMGDFEFAVNPIGRQLGITHRVLDVPMTE
jgi:hypothetical protein